MGKTKWPRREEHSFEYLSFEVRELPGDRQSNVTGFPRPKKSSWFAAEVLTLFTFEMSVENIADIDPLAGRSAVLISSSVREPFRLAHHIS